MPVAGGARLIPPHRQGQAMDEERDEARERETATAEILKIIAASPGDPQPAFDAIVESAQRPLAGHTGIMTRIDGDLAYFQAATSVDAEADAAVRATYPRPAPDCASGFGARLLSGGFAERADTETDFQGTISLVGAQPHAFTERHIALVQSFADQAVIAIENVRLFEQVRARTRELSASLDELRKTQDRLIRTEKLASLGQLTAGIAHEIKNPLNFVNNFSALSRELLDELRELLAKANLVEADRKEAEELIGMTVSNLDKVVTHGKRADSIVRNMLLHSREGSGAVSSVNVNAMVEEALNLAYHGARAEKPDFKVTVDKSLNPNAGVADLRLQELTRVLLNLISNGFYATAKRKQNGSGAAYEPIVSASTRDLGDRVEIAIRDNGTGIPDDVKAKIFNPFFTTKPAGEGAGLGLSLSHDIVVKQHGGTLEVATEPGVYTEFTIILPRPSRSQQTATESV